MESREDLHDATAGGVAPQVESAQLELADNTFEILDVVLDEIPRAGIPIRIAVSSHVDSDDVIAIRQNWEQCGRTCAPRGRCRGSDERWLVTTAPIQIVDAEAVDGRILVARRRRRLHAERRTAEAKGQERCEKQNTRSQ